MNRLTSGMVPLCALLLVVGCQGDPTAPLRDNGVDKLVASPSQMFLQLGASKVVDVGAVDAQGNPLEFDYLVTATGSGITVARDSTFLPVYVNDTLLAVPPQAPIFQFKVVATAYGATSFTVSAGGKDVVIPVQVVPQNQIDATFSDSTPALGDTVTITAPAGSHFTQTAALQIAGAADSLNPLIVDRAADGSSIRFIPPPNLNGPLTISEVVADAAPDLVFNPATSALLTTPLFDTVDVVYSNPTPALGGAVSVTIDNPLLRFRPDAIVNFPGQLPGSASGPAAIAVSADSSTLSFQAPPNAAGNGTVVSFVFPGGFSFALPTRTGITAPNIGTDLNATFAPASPATLQPVTITAPAGFIFGPLATDSVTIGGQLAVNQSLGAGGSSITVIPIPGSSGVATIAGVSPSAAPQFVLTMNTVATTSSPALVPLVGTDDPATAPTLTIPTPGNSVTINDAGSFDGPSDCCFGGPTRLYKFTLAATTTLTFTVDWFQGQDLGVYITQADAITTINAGDNFGGGPTGHPETVSLTLPAGTYFAAIPNFGPGAPSFFKLTISNP